MGEGTATSLPEDQKTGTLDGLKKPSAQAPGLRATLVGPLALWPSGLLVIWAVLRLFASLAAAYGSTVRPLTEREQAIPLWPPSGPFGTWLDRFFVQPWIRWDAVYFINGVVQGQRSDDGSAQFHPLLIWLTVPFHFLFGNAPLMLLIVSSLCTLALLAAFAQLARLDLDERTARTATLLLLCCPLAFCLFAPYTEPPFLLFAVLCLYWARTRNWLWAGIAAGLAVLARQQGIFLVLPLAWEMWEASERVPHRFVRQWRTWLNLAWVPAAFAGWLAVRAFALSDLQVDASSPQRFIYSFFISPSSSHVVQEQHFSLPHAALWDSFMILAQPGPDSPVVAVGVSLLLSFSLLLGIVATARHMRKSYLIWSLVVVLVSLSYHTGPINPTMGMPRHLYLAFPLFIAAATWLQKRFLLRSALLATGIFGMLFLVMLFVLHAWVP